VNEILGTKKLKLKNLQRFRKCTYSSKRMFVTKVVLFLAEEERSEE
jgi:hypothetical protein